MTEDWKPGDEVIIRGTVIGWFVDKRSNRLEVEIPATTVNRIMIRPRDVERPR